MQNEESRKSALVQKVITIPKWQITLTSDNCKIEKHADGWQIRSGASNEDNPESNSEEQNSGIIKMVNAEICCNRENVDDLFSEEEADQSSSSIVLKEYLSLLTDEDARINFIVKILTKAIEERRVYVICGTFPALRKPLRKRGWIEKRAIRKMLSNPSDLNGVEAIEKLLRTPADLIWYTNKKVAVAKMDDKTIINKFAGSYFTSKVDMCNNLESVCWFYEAGVSNIQFPRCYNVSQAAQVEEFVQDFYITACMGILKWFLFLASLAGPSATCSPNGSVPIDAILFALERCAEHISAYMHEDIDKDDRNTVAATEWNQFLNWHERIMIDHELLRDEGKADVEDLLRLTGDVLRDMIEHRSECRIDGMRNVWILKPGDKSLGRGIILKCSLHEILGKINQVARESMQYVVQKYIERPLLVYNRKIDVRQWFLITSTQPLIIWMYRDVLIRFASKDFTLDNFHESIHLCNTTVQLKYRKSFRTNFQIPSELHWNLQHFKEYLKYTRFHVQATGRESAWERIVKPGIKQNLIGALLASQENMVNRKNSFQVYGADFIIMDDLSVWLIEINTNPRLHPPSSSVTEKLYPEVIEDVVKVVLDRRKNRKAAQGRFECIFKQRNPFSGHVLGKAASLGVRGTAVPIYPRKPAQPS